MRWRSASLTACSCALLTAGCGAEQRRATEPKLPATLATRLASESETIARALKAGDRCAAIRTAVVLQHEVIGAVNAHQVPKLLQEPLTSRTTDLVARLGNCTQPPAAASTLPQPRSQEKPPKQDQTQGQEGGD